MSAAAVDFNESTHTYTVNGIIYPSVTTVIKDAGIGWDYRGPNAEFYKSRGTAGHKAIFLLENGRLGSYHPDLTPYLQGYEAFKADTGWSPISTEKIVYSSRWMFAGMLDQLGRMGASDTIDLLDIKCSPYHNDEYRIQTAGYAIAVEEMTSIKVANRYCLNLPGNGEYKLTPHTHKDDRKAFLACLTIASWRRKLKG